ncbi:hypothetical protein KEJ37_07625, partial [Candidatus Bathyarchaeota archaeon]|nr:hypothetical protein [Candidatus Bathyarchaeota archaeon]
TILRHAGLGLIVVDDAFDVYKNSNMFVSAISKESSLEVGDLKVFSAIKIYTRRLSYYYFGVAVFLASVSLALPHILNQAMLASLYSWRNSPNKLDCRICKLAACNIHCVV